MAIEVNIQIIRVFSKIREMLLTHKDILLKLELVEKKLLKQNGKMKKYEEDPGNFQSTETINKFASATKRTNRI